MYQFIFIFQDESLKKTICWENDGASFLVKNVTAFSDKLLPYYFRHSNFASFVRQLNMYDFHKVKTDSSDLRFSHPQFKRGEYDLLASIKRKPTIPIQDNSRKDESNKDGMQELNTVITDIRKRIEHLESKTHEVDQLRADLQKIKYLHISYSFSDKYRKVEKLVYSCAPMIALQNGVTKGQLSPMPFQNNSMQGLYKLFGCASYMTVDKNICETLQAEGAKVVEQPSEVSNDVKRSNTPTPERHSQQITDKFQGFQVKIDSEDNDAAILKLRTHLKACSPHPQNAVTEINEPSYLKKIDFSPDPQRVEGIFPEETANNRQISLIYPLINNSLMQTVSSEIFNKQQIFK